MLANTLSQGVQMQIEAEKNNYSITELDRIRYQINKQHLTVSELLKTRNADGSDRNPEEIDIYQNTERYRKELDKNSRYFRNNNLPKKAYTELCTRLRISPNIDSMDELLEIKEWKEVLKKQDIDYGQKTDFASREHLSSEDLEETQTKGNEEKPKIKFGKFFALARQNATDGIDDLVQDILRQEEVHCYEADVYEDKCHKQDFLAYTATVPQEVLFLWNQYPRFFDTDYIAELVFFEEYMKLGKNGKKILHELITAHFENNEYCYSDEQIELYQSMCHVQIPEDKTISFHSAEEIWQNWKHYYEPEGLKWHKDIALLVINSQKSDWDVLADYHRFRVLYGDAENGTYLPMIEQTMAILTQLPFCKK